MPRKLGSAWHRVQATSAGLVLGHELPGHGLPATAPFAGHLQTLVHLPDVVPQVGVSCEPLVTQFTADWKKMTFNVVFQVNLNQESLSEFLARVLLNIQRKCALFQSALQLCAFVVFRLFGIYQTFFKYYRAT